MQPFTPISASEPINRIRHRQPLRISPSEPEKPDENTPRTMGGSDDFSIHPFKSRIARRAVDGKRNSEESEEPTIRGIRNAFAETPTRLRELEIGWREKRRAGLAERRQNGVLAKDRGGMSMPKGDSGRDSGTPKNQEDIMGRSRIAEERVCLKERQIRVSGVKYGRQESRRRDGTSLQRMREVQATYTKDNIAPPPEKIIPLAPPSPPLTPPLTTNRHTPYRTDILEPPHRANAVRQHKLVSGLPTTVNEYSCTIPITILASPLPPTSQPVPLGRRSRDTIHIHPSTCNTGITLNLGGSEIRICSKGTTMTFWSKSKKGMMLDRTLDLGSAKKWSEGDKRDWELVRRLAEGYKRHIPKVRLYLPLGHISITCSSPPDVILSFDFTPVESRSRSPRQATGSDSITTKIRLRMSRMNSEIVIDTSSTPRTGERVRTRRTISVDQTMVNNGVSDGQSLIDTLQGVLRGAKDWSEAEKEGLRRLIQLKEEWMRYG